MNRYLIALILLTQHAYLFAGELPDFKGIALGSSIQEIESNNRFECHVPPPKHGDKACLLKNGEEETIAGAPVKGIVLAYFAGKLGYILIRIDEKYFYQVAEALTEKYGKGAAKTSIVQNRMGAEFENKEISWRKGGASINAKRYTGKLDTSSVTYTTDSWVTESMDRSGTASKEQSKDL